MLNEFLLWDKKAANQGINHKTVKSVISPENSQGISTQVFYHFFTSGV